MTGKESETFVQIKINGKLVKYEMVKSEDISIEEADRRAMETSTEVES